MNRSPLIWRRALRALIATVASLTLLVGAACDARKSEPAALPKTNEVSSAPVVVSPLPNLTNAPPSPTAPRTPNELFQAAQKLAKGTGDTRDPAAAARLYAEAAGKGHVDAQAYLAAAYRTGAGVVKNPTEAARWFRAAAEQGDARSQGVLASMYGTGEGVAKDPVEAVKWYRRAAEQGQVRAQANLGALLFLGQGVPKDPVEAYKWLHLAAQKGDQEAVKNRGNVAARLSVAQMNEGRKRAAEFVTDKTKLVP